MPRELILYKTPTCSTCSMVMRRFDDAGLDYRVVNLEDEPDTAHDLRQAGFTQVPVIRWLGKLHTVVDLSAIIASAKEARTA